MKSLPELIFEVCEETHVPMAEAVFGDAGLEAIFRLMEVTRRLYQHVEPERVAGHVIIFRTISGNSVPKSPGVRVPADFTSLQTKVALILFLRSMPTELRIPHPLRLTTFSKLR